MPKNSKSIYGLPAKYYTDQRFWEIECNTVLADGWLFVGFVHELLNSGDVIPISIAGKPILLVKNSKGKIAAFHNVCSHRCLKLVDKKKNVGKIIRCPYHSWTYDLDGKLKASPHFGGTNKHTPKGFNNSDHGLKPIRTHIWHDWIFINLNGKAKKFEEYAKPLIKKFKGVNFKKIRNVATLDFGKINSNWKFLIENFIEPYHVQFVHKTTTKQPLKDHYTIVVVGTGNLGGAMIRLLAPLGPKIIGVNRKGEAVDGCSKAITVDKIDSILPEADILYLAMPETPGTKNLISRKRLDILKPSCGIINIGRQSAMDYDVLCEKLRTNKLAGAILDVFAPEPIELNSKLWQIPNLIITPHVSADDGESYVRLTLELFTKNLKLFISNKPLINQINKNLGY